MDAAGKAKTVVAGVSPASYGTVPVPVLACDLRLYSDGETPPELAAETTALHYCVRRNKMPPKIPLQILFAWATCLYVS